MLETFELLCDFGLLVLIWMVQLIVYPSFLYYTPKNLVIWHQKYTGRIAMVVVPLMFGQLGITLYQVYETFQAMTLIKLGLVLFVWVFTFAYFAPTHGKISNGDTSQEQLSRLVGWNWWRTLAWTLVTILSLYKMIDQ